MLLETAGILHDIGIYITPTSHHKHSAYLVNASEIFGLKDKAVVDSTALAAAHSLKISFDGGATPLEISLWEKKGSPESWLLNHSELKAKKIAYAVSKASLSAIEPAKEAPVLPAPEQN